jgi:hypothetical protein
MEKLWQFLNGIRFEHPEFIWWQSVASFGLMLLLVLLAATTAIWWFWWRGRVKAVATYGTLELVTRFTSLPGRASALLVLAGLVASVVLALTAATMPYQPMGAVNVPAGSVRIVAAFDVSKSMAAENRDEPPLYGGRSCRLVEGPCGRRIETAKLILTEQIMPVVEGNQIGLVVYAGSAASKSLLTHDFSPLRTILTSWRWVDTGAAVGEGSFVHSGLNAAIEMFKADPADPGEENIIVLFTDGGNNSLPEDLAKTMESLRQVNARLIIVGVGSTEASYVPLYDRNDKPIYTKDGRRAYHEQGGQVAETARNDAFLAELSAMSGGRVVYAAPGKALDINWPTSFAGTKVEIAKKYLYAPLIAVMLAVIGIIWLVGSFSGRIGVKKGAGA